MIDPDDSPKTGTHSGTQTDPVAGPQTGPQGNSAYRQMLSEIREGSLLPGDRLRETELAQRLGVSRTPVREAIRQLEADGLVAHVPRTGATVRRLDYPEVMELYEMRAVLEGTAARLAARAASDIELEELAALHDRLAATGDPKEAARLNRVFHATLLDAAKNRFLSKSMGSLQKAMMILGPTMLSDSARAEAADDEHRRVLDAMAARDGAAAEAAMRAHIEASQRLRIRTLRERERGTEDDE
ncbi:GntR family transcriptional regulator [Aliishimia ponticola]|uniref:GntR family transcriptional regulator n=1 Tax=Aliishimia ponticola TaxID=2499833 RepID=A0A4S4NPK1_9RHOB|nr:GntR family transcriptional regulator [Aliishimia ponticola]THH38150.1 GntR family transcriptional regulator [Aliishimia ponticola]